MIGSKVITLDARNFLAGLSTNDAVADGGYSPGGNIYQPLKTQMNFAGYPGLMYAPERPVDKTPNSDFSTHLLYSSCADPDGFTNEKYFVGAPHAGASNDGRYYKWNGTTLTYAQQDTTNSYFYQSLIGTGQLVTFKGYIYSSLSSQIVRLPDGMASIDSTWWTGLGRTLTSGNRHPMIVYEDGLYIANEDEICYWDGTTSVQTKLQLSDTNYSITALGIDQGSGLMLVAFSLGSNASHTLNQPAFLGYYDGFSNKFRKVVRIDEAIEAFYNVGDTIYVTYGKNIGYWTGSGIQFLRRLSVGFDNAELLYPAKITSIGNILYYLDRYSIIAFGDITRSSGKVFYCPLSSLSEGSTSVYTMITNLGQGKLAVCYKDNSSGGKFYTFDTAAYGGASDGGYFLTNKIEFDRPVTFNQMVIDYATSMPFNTYITSAYLFGNTQLTESVLLGNTVKLDSGMTQFTAPLAQANLEVSSMQFLLSHGSSGVTSNLGIERIRIFVTPKD